MTLEDKLKQLHENCEILKKRNSTPEAEEQHKKNSLRTYAGLYSYYRGVGCSREHAKKYAKLVIENQIKKNHY